MHDKGYPVTTLIKSDRNGGCGCGGGRVIKVAITMKYDNIS